MLNIKVQLTKLKNRIKYNSLIRFFSFLGVLNSPFKRLKISFYFGDITKGTPYFLPRKWVKSKINPGYLTAIPVKYFYIQFISLGYKTKWSNDDFRYEWPPMISIVLLKKQIVISFGPLISDYMWVDEYWESWLYYKYFTKGNTKERLKQLTKFDSGDRKRLWGDETGHHDENFNIYDFIIKNKWKEKE